MAQGQSGDGIKLYVLFFITWVYCVLSPGTHLLACRLCASPYWTQWQVGTKRNESLRNVTWHPQTKTKDWDSNQDSDTDLYNERSYNSGNNWPRFLFVESSSDDLPLSKLSPFAVQKGFQVVAGTLKSIKRLKDGSFRVECDLKSQAMGLLKTDSLIDQYTFPSTKC